MNGHWLRPTGITIEVTLPRWPFRVGRILIGLALLLMVVLAIPLAFVVNKSVGGGSSGSATGWTVMEAVRDSTSLRVTAKVSQSGDGGLANNGWSIVVDDGRVVPGTVVDGPERFRGGDGSPTTVTFPLNPGDRPVRLRYDPDGQLIFSQALTLTP